MVDDWVRVGEVMIQVVDVSVHCTYHASTSFCSHSEAMIETMHLEM